MQRLHERAYRWFTTISVFFMFLIFTPKAFAERLSLPSDPDLKTAVGTGIFVGFSDDIDFERVQNLIPNLELSVPMPFETWLYRIDIYGAASWERAVLTYKNDPGDRETSDGDGGTMMVQRDGLLRAEVVSKFHWTLTGGLRVGVFSTDWLVVNAFAQYSGTTKPISTKPEVVLVRALGNKMDVADDLEGRAELTERWHLLRTGATLGFPIDFDKILLPHWRVVPFATAGFIRFRSTIDIEIVDEELMALLEAVDVARRIPDEKKNDVDSFTASVGVRVDLGRHHGFEATGSFFADKETTVYWLAAGYTFRFDYPWEW